MSDREMDSTEPLGDHGRGQADFALIEETVGRLEHAQQTEDIVGFTRLFRADAVWVTAAGRRLIGWDEISEFTRSVLPGAMKVSTARYEIAHITFLRTDVAVVNVDQIPITLDGEPLDQPEGRPTYVMTKEQGEWVIAAGQNTQVRDSSDAAPERRTSERRREAQ